MKKNYHDNPVKDPIHMITPPPPKKKEKKKKRKKEKKKKKKLFDKWNIIRPTIRTQST